MENAKLKTILNDLSLEEKIGQLIQLPGEFFQSSSISLGPKEKLGISNEIVKNTGSVLNVIGAEKTREVQEKYLNESRHKIPLLFMADIIYGYRTIFPIPLGLGATWNPELVQEAYRIIGEEAFSGGVHVTLSPMVDLVRDARWGRCLESTGEDAVLNSQFAKAMVKGLQQDLTSTQGIASCVKHFAAYGASEAGRDYNTVDMSERRLRQDYLPSYKAAVEAGCELVMTSFNTYDGLPVSGNEFLLKDVLRKEWGFDGIIISDYAAIRELIQHGIAENDREATKLAMQASVDIDMKSPCYANELEPLIEEGEINESLINEAVWRVLKLKNRLGLFEDPYRGVTKETERETLLKPDFRSFSKKVATESIVLLKNDKQALPLTPNKDSILLVGPYGDSQELIGLWAIEGDSKDAVTLKSGLEKYVSPSNFAYEYGTEMLDNYEFLGEFGGRKPTDAQKLSPENRKVLLEQAIEAGKKADVIIIAAGEHPMQSGEAGSRADIRLPELQRQLIKEMSLLNKKTVLVTFSGRPLVLTEEEKQVDAMLHAWFPGIEGGNALADILFGTTNPSGKLSMSFPYHVGQLPIYYNEFNTGRPLDSKEHTGRFVSKYLDVPNEPLFPFGHGLSYSTIHYSHLEVDHEQMQEKLTVRVVVENTDNRQCLETVQLYIRDLVGSVVRPKLELKNFQKVILAPGERKTIQFEITREDLKFYTKDLSFDVETGTFDVFVGPNSIQTLQTSFELV